MFNPWHDIKMDPKADTFTAMIEVPRGSKVKYELDKDTGLIAVDRILHSSCVYPANYGFIPRTYCDDNDPLDVLVLGDHPFVPGSLCQVRIIGVMKMIDGGEEDDKLIAVHADDPAWRDFTDIAEIPAHRFSEIRQFFLDYKTLERKRVEVTDILGAADGRKVLADAFELYAREEANLREA